MLVNQGCNLNKYIPSGKYIIEDVKIKGAPGDERDELYSLLKISPNKKVLGVVKLNMWEYLLFNTPGRRQRWADKSAKYNKELIAAEAELAKTDTSDKKTRGKIEARISRLEDRIKRYDDREEDLLKTEWEKPVLLDSQMLFNSGLQMKEYMFHKGYFYDTVSYKVKTIGKKAYITFNLVLGKAFYIRKLDYEIFDKRIADIVAGDTANRLVEPGQKFDGDILTAERNRLTLLLRENGYYNFRRDYIYYDIDSSHRGNTVNVGLGIANPTARTRHRFYKIGKIYVEPEYIKNDTTSKDTVAYKGLYFISRDLRIKPSILGDYIFFNTGDIYKAIDYQSTINRLSQLGSYKFVDIQYHVDTVGRPDTGILSVFIKLTPFKKQEIDYGLELNSIEQSQADIPTTRSVGSAANVLYMDKNLGHTDLQLQIKPYGSVELPISILQHANAIDTPAYTYGVTTSFILHRLLVPHIWPFWPLSDEALRRNAQTSFNFNYIVESSKYYQRNTGSLYMTWTENFDENHVLSVTPIEISYVNTGFVSNTFRASIDSTHNPLLINLFDQHLITDFRMAYRINRQPFTLVKKPYWYLLLSFETGGNVPALASLASHNFKDPAKDSGAVTGKIFGIDYYQYTKLEADYQYYLPVFGKDNLALRAIGGFGAPESLVGLFFPNTQSSELPFEKQFYVGGANDIRAWKLRTLGPGSYYDPFGSQYYDKSGDIKLEANAELRFPIYSVLKGSIFTDAGNVWLYNNDPLRPGSGFGFNTFYKEIAIGSGIGFRFDFNLFVVRLDFAVPLYNPALDLSDRWQFYDIDHQSAWFTHNLQINLGIGYPF